MTALSVVIPTRDRCGMLLEALAPVLADPGVDEVIVVDDGSSDGTWPALEALAELDPRVAPHRLDGGGPARARQHGALKASGDVLLFLEDDVYVRPELGTRHLARQAGHQDLIVVGYTPVELPDPARVGGGPMRLYAREYERVCSRWERRPDDVLLSLFGGHFSMRRDRALEVGLVDDRFPERCHEDQDFGLRCRRAGLRGRFDRDLVASHRYTRDIRAFQADARCRGAGKFRVHQLHADLAGPFAPSAWWEDLPRPAAGLVRATSRPRLRRATVSVLAGLARVAAVARLSPAELALLQLTRRVLLLDGARAASRASADADLRVRSARP